MIPLTLNQKITIKGRLESKGITGPEIASITERRSFCHYWRMAFGAGQPILEYWLHRTTPAGKRDWRNCYV
jgi:hypothetical protein